MILRGKTSITINPSGRPIRNGNGRVPALSLLPDASGRRGYVVSEEKQRER